MSTAASTRTASHAGSWYDSDGQTTGHETERQRQKGNGHAAFDSSCTHSLLSFSLSSPSPVAVRCCTESSLRRLVERSEGVEYRSKQATCESNHFAVSHIHLHSSYTQREHHLIVILIPLFNLMDLFSSCYSLFFFFVSHAGYTYSGPTAAYAFKHINPADVSVHSQRQIESIASG